jgi:hypothetical protein
MCSRTPIQLLSKKGSLYLVRKGAGTGDTSALSGTPRLIRPLLLIFLPLASEWEVEAIWPQVTVNGADDVYVERKGRIDMVMGEGLARR